MLGFGAAEGEERIGSARLSVEVGSFGIEEGRPQVMFGNVSNGSPWDDWA